MFEPAADSKPLGGRQELRGAADQRRVGPVVREEATQGSKDHIPDLQDQRPHEGHHAPTREAHGSCRADWPEGR